MDKIGEWMNRADDLIWGPGLLLLFLGTGCFLTLRLRFLPIRNLKYALLCAIGREKGNGKKKETYSQEQEGGISSFSSLMTELAATIGTGNIVGVATAMVLGGPGALLWMMLSAMIGMATKLVESTLSVKYRSRNDRNEIVGGPMYVMEQAFPLRRMGHWMGVCFSIFAVMASFGMGNMTQANSIGDAMKAGFGIPEEKTALILTILTILVVLGGIQSIAKVTRFVVPLMGIFYMAGTLFVIFSHLPNVPLGVYHIIAMAFCPQAVSGGIMGNLTVSVMESLRWGVSRGVFSNEAGLGAAGISAAAAGTRDYIKQGYISMTGVFLDTIVICSVTGLALAASGVLGTTDAAGELLTGTELTIAAFGTTFGELGVCFISICIALFAFATIVGWAYQGEKAFEFIVHKSKYCILYRFFYGLTAFVGVVCSLELVWDFSDICNALMAVPNLICVLVLSGEVIDDILRYEKQK